MKILFFTLGPEIVASSRTRVYQYLPFFRADGIDYKAVTYESGLAYYLHRFRPKSITGRITKRLLSQATKRYNLFFSFFKTLWFLVLSNFYDLIFLQKVLLPTFIIKLLKRKGKGIVFDFDDAIYAKPTNYNKGRFDQQLHLYDLLVIETAFTGEYVRRFRNNNILTVTGPIDCKRYHPGNGAGKDEIVIGWIGSPVSASARHLYMLETVVKKLSGSNKGLVLVLIGAPKVGFAEARVKLKKWSLETEVADLQSFDIGIMPLPDNEWTRGKGGYKLLQYMAVGVPCVAAPVGINKELIRDGENGFLATTEEEWYEKLSLLIDNPELRREMGRRGRAYVVRNHSFEAAAPKLISALKHAIQENKQKP